MRSCTPRREDRYAVNRNTMFVMFAAIAVVAIGMGYWIYTDQSRSGVDVNIGGNTLSIRER
jgi:hypothetical protein